MRHIRLSTRQFVRVISYLPSQKLEREKFFTIPDKRNESPYKRAKYTGGQLILEDVGPIRSAPVLAELTNKQKEDLESYIYCMRRRKR